MTSAMKKVAYTSFSSSFVIWILVFFAVCFPTGVWSTPIRFPNSSLFLLFFGSAVVAAVSGLVIGLDYLGFDLKLKHKPREVPQIPKLHSTIPLSQMAGPVSIKEEENQVSTEEEKTASVVVRPQLEVEQEINNRKKPN